MVPSTLLEGQEHLGDVQVNPAIEPKRRFP